MSPQQFLRKYNRNRKEVMCTDHMDKFNSLTIAEMG
jgi:hypothetical protein